MRLIIAFLFLLLCTTNLIAQNSHLGNLINVYKEQKKESMPSNPAPGPPASSSAHPRPATPPPPPPPAWQGVPEEAWARGGLLRDPTANPDDIINQAPAEAIELTDGKLAHRAGSDGILPLIPRSPSPPNGNRKDPLNADFVPYLERHGQQTSQPTPYDEMLGDARLNDVFFLDAHRGWAVGDRGAIWYTENGGVNWVLQESPIACTLYSVQFHDSQFGFAVGGYPFPFSSQGRGVILTTHDGGRNWGILNARGPLADLPILHRVKIFDTLKILLAGESSEKHPTGLYLTTDGGRNWRPQQGGKTNGWTALDLYDDKTGLGIDSLGVIQQLQNQHGKSQSIISQTPSFGTSKLAQVRAVLDPKAAGNITGWMVGSGGLVLSTLDRGLRWSIVPGKLPGNSSTMVDLNTIEARGTKLWVAGNPGTHIFSSADLGKTWKATPSGTTATIRRIVFADDKTGWAVGDLGTVLKTEDGGATWKTQRAGGSRLAVLGVFGTAEDIPWEAFASICAHQGYLGGAALVFREEDRSGRNGDRLESPWLDRAHDAMIRTGGVGLWELGAFRLERREWLKDSAHLVRMIERENDNRGMQRLRERLVMLIRQWRPDVILTKDSGASKEPARDLVLRELMEAVKLAGDAKIFPYQITELGLEAWNVKKVHVALEDGNLGDVTLATTDASIRFGQSYDELAFVSRGLLQTSNVPQTSAAPALQSFLTAFDAAPSEYGKDFFAGIRIAPASDARRALSGSYTNYWDEIKLRLRQRQQTAGIIRKLGETAEKNSRKHSDVRLASSAAELTRKIDRDAAVRVLLDMGKKYHVGGDWESAREAYEIIARQYSTHPLARYAFQWLLQYQTGEEPGWRKHVGSISQNVQTAFNKDGSMTVAGSAGASLNRHRLDPRLDKGLALGRFLSENMPDLREDAQIRFAIASAQRRWGNLPEAIKYYRQRGKLEYDDIWGMRARSELWLVMGSHESYGREELPDELRELPMASMICSRVDKKPWLDGQFDQESDSGVWMQSKLYAFTPAKPRMRLQEMLKGATNGGSGLQREEQSRAESKNFGTRVMFLCDQEYLYIGLRCPRVAGFSYPPIPEKPRSRDAEMGGSDRVEILLDVDRDYGPAYSVTIDSRGWVVDSCWGDKTWNPEFRVARHEDKDAWYIEAALALNSLTDMPPLPGTAWNVGLRRIVPGQGIECWNAENSFDLTEGFGPLLFE